MHHKNKLVILLGLVLGLSGVVRVEAMSSVVARNAAKRTEATLQPGKNRTSGSNPALGAFVARRIDPKSPLALRQAALRGETVAKKKSSWFSSLFNRGEKG